MRCRFCGSEAVHSAEENKGFSTGKAIAGTIVFGPAGSVAGLAGKRISGYRCAACGQFMEQLMDSYTEESINDAIYNMKKGPDAIMYDFYKGRYENYKSEFPNIGEVENNNSEMRAGNSTYTSHEADNTTSEKKELPIKRTYYYGLWQKDAPVFVKTIVIKSNQQEDYLLLLDAINQNEQTIRSLYFQAVAYDDTGDVLTTNRFVYQDVGVAPGSKFPKQLFGLGTKLAYRVDISFEKSSFEDGTVWRNESSAEPIRLEPPKYLDGNSFPRLKYLVSQYRAIQEGYQAKTSDNSRKSILRNKLAIKKPECQPHFKDDYWQCTCGMPVQNGKACPVCHCNEDEMKNLFSQSYLESVQRSEILSRAKTRAQQVQSDREEIISGIYEEAERLRKDNTKDSLQKAITCFRRISGLKNSDALLEECENTIEIIEEEEARRKAENRKREAKREREQEQQRKKRLILGTIVAAIVIVGAIVIKMISGGIKYKGAYDDFNKGAYLSAVEKFSENGSFKDSEEMARTSIEYYFRELLKKDIDNVERTLSKFDFGNSYKDVIDFEKKCPAFTYEYAISCLEISESDAVYIAQNEQIRTDEDPKFEIDRTAINNAIQLFELIPDYEDSSVYVLYSEAINDYMRAINDYSGVYCFAAKRAFEGLNGFRESELLIKSCEYHLAYNKMIEENRKVREKLAGCNLEEAQAILSEISNKDKESQKLYDDLMVIAPYMGKYRCIKIVRRSDGAEATSRLVGSYADFKCVIDLNEDKPTPCLNVVTLGETKWAWIFVEGETVEYGNNDGSSRCQMVLDSSMLSIIHQEYTYYYERVE